MSIYPNKILTQTISRKSIGTNSMNAPVDKHCLGRTANRTISWTVGFQESIAAVKQNVNDEFRSFEQGTRR